MKRARQSPKEAETVSAMQASLAGAAERAGMPPGRQDASRDQISQLESLTPKTQPAMVPDALPLISPETERKTPMPIAEVAAGQMAQFQPPFQERSPYGPAAGTRMMPSSPQLIVARANRWRDFYNPFRHLNIQRAISMMEFFRRGWFADLEWMYSYLEQNHDTLMALMGRRLDAIAEMDWDIRIADDHPEFDETLADEQASALRGVYDNMDNLTGEGGAIEHLATSVFRGFAHVEIQGDRNAPHLEPVMQWNIVRDGYRGLWKYNPDSRLCGFESLPDNLIIDPQNFLIAENHRHIDWIALLIFLRKNLAVKDWAGFIEIYGIPSGVITMAQNAPQDPQGKAQWEQAAKSVAEGGSGAIPFGSAYTPNDSPRGTDPFTPYLKYLDEQLILIGTGGKLTMLTESGSGTLAGGAHEDTFQQIAKAHGKRIAGVFNVQFDRQFLADNFPGQPVLAYWQFAEESDVDAICAQVTALSGAGLKVDAEEIGERTGYTLEDKPEPVPMVGKPGEPSKPGQPKDTSQAKDDVENRDGWVTIDDHPVFIGISKDWTGESKSSDTKPKKSHALSSESQEPETKGPMGMAHVKYEDKHGKYDTIRPPFPVRIAQTSREREPGESETAYQLRLSAIMAHDNARRAISDLPRRKDGTLDFRRMSSKQIDSVFGGEQTILDAEGAYLSHVRGSGTKYPPHKNRSEKIENARHHSAFQPRHEKGQFVTLEAKGRELFAKALADDLGPARERLKAIMGISDPALLKKKLHEFLTDFPQMQKDIMADPAAARALEGTISAALINGMAEGAKQ